MDIDWNIRFNRMVEKCGTNNPTLFTDTARWFAAPSELDFYQKCFLITLLKMMKINIKFIGRFWFK